MKLLHENLSTQITALCPVQQLLLVGQGQHVLVFNMENDELVSKLQVFMKVSVHGFHCCVEQEDSFGHLVLVWGQRCFVVLHISSSGQCKVVISEEVTEDWIVAGSWIPSPTSTCSSFSNQNLVIQSSNSSELSGNGEDSKREVLGSTRSFILQTAHSAALIYSVHPGCSAAATIGTPETLYQILEKHEILKYGNTNVKNIPCKNWSWQSCPCGGSNGACSVKVSLIDRLQCTDKCVLFSGCIITESNLCPGKSSLRGHSHLTQGCASSENSEDAFRTSDMEKSCCSASVLGLQTSWVCVGGTVMGDLIIWGAAGDCRATEIAPWHTIKVHKGAVFSVSWNPALHLLTTTSDDRLVRVWSVGDGSSTTHNVNSESLSNGQINLKQCHIEAKEPKSCEQDLSNSAECIGASRLRPSEFKRTSTFGGCSLNSSKVLEIEKETRPQLCWNSCSVRLWVSCEGHEARAWRGCVVELGGRPLVVGGGEDSRVCVWDCSGTLLREWVAHEGASIWCIKPVQGQSNVVLVTAGGDGAVKRWSLSNLLGGGRSIELFSLPWYDINMRKKASAVSQVVTNSKKTTMNKFLKDNLYSSASSKVAEPPQAELANNSFIPKVDTDAEEIEQGSLFPCPNPVPEAVRGDSVTQRINSVDVDSNELENMSSEGKQPSTAHVQLSRRCSKDQHTFVRCLALVGTSHCVLTLDNGQVWLWKLPQYNQPGDTKSDCSQTPEADAPVHLDTTSELGSLKTSSPSFPEMSENQSAYGIDSLNEDLNPPSNSEKEKPPVAPYTAESDSHSKSLGETATSSSSWRLVVDDSERLGGYSAVAVAPSSSAVAVCGLHGHVVVWPDILLYSAVLRVRAAKSKIISCIWVSSTELLLSVGCGGLLLYRLTPDSLSLDASFELPPSKQRWCTAAVLLSVPRRPPCCEDTCIVALITGDRSGNLHLFTKQNIHPAKSLRSVHGSGGVTSARALPATARGALAVTAGRDGCLRYWRCFQSPSAAGIDLARVGGTRQSGGSWVAEVRPWHQDWLVLSFKEVHLRVWSAQHRAEVAQVACGGGHRAWGVCIAEGGAAGGRQDLLTAVYLKEGLPQCSYQPLCPRLLPLLTGVSSKPVLCGTVVHSSARGAVVVLAGEDNSVQLQLVTACGARRSLLSVVSHISAVRCIGLIKPAPLVRDRCTSNVTLGPSPNLQSGTVHSPELRAVSGQRSHASHFNIKQQDLDNSPFCNEVLECTSGESNISSAPLESEEGEFVWFVTGGGRAQLKVWRCSTQNLDDVAESYDLKTCSSAAKDDQVTFGSFTGPKTNETQTATINTGAENLILQSEATETHASSNLGDLDQLSPNLGKFSRPASASPNFGPQPTFAECAEMVDFQLSRSRSSSWRHQQVQVDAEVRHMACCGMWLTSTTAIVAVASSDGSLRVLKLCGADAAPALEEVCVLEWPRCLLTVDLCLVGGDCALLRATDTGGHLLCCCLQDVLTSLKGAPDAAPLELVCHHQLHDMGINALAARASPSQPAHSTATTNTNSSNLSFMGTVSSSATGAPEMAGPPTGPKIEEAPQAPPAVARTDMLLTGGDDNAVALSRLTAHLTSAGPRIDVQRLAVAVGHYSQVTGISWLTEDTFVSCSVDQRVVLWLIGGADRLVLQPTRSFFSAVADIHGLLVWPTRPSQATATCNFDSSRTSGCAGLGYECPVPACEAPRSGSESYVTSSVEGSNSVTLKEGHSVTSVALDDGGDQRNSNESSGRIMVFGMGCETFSISDAQSTR